ncbi:DUF2634 domain-containing protein [Paenibacillus pasadenensis]|uniref:Phage-like element PBSX protein xkdS n=1 Tax=Paenibacillus pasadenensis TaxID=217090 RepID=A0A2N5N9W2_9BACL|nr:MULTISPECIES: DUF2634 domain-containing protein [Paenibacillus]PLT47070.1 Phage-like element PBSX protein xkdS [Paenibacillus pasadenensis]QGG57410.1 DUF2634 domain-containing protein [Paenibacillus sp. B01]
MSVPEQTGLDWTAAEAVERPSLTYPIHLDGRTGGRIDGLAAMRQFVFKQLSTVRWEHEVYTGEVGLERSSYDIAAAVEEALLADSRVLAVEDMQMRREGDGVSLTFTVRTVFGSFKEEAMAGV